MRKKTVQFDHIVDRDYLAKHIANQWTEWHHARVKKIEEWKEVRNYIFATDTKTTSNSTLPWKHTTTIPKLTQIRDNLHANYHANLFPQESWMKWEAHDQKAKSKDKAEIAQGYLETKHRQTSFTDVVSELLLDYIDYGNVFAKVGWEQNWNMDANGVINPVYVGPRLFRISPYDIVFNPTAASFRDSPKIVREVYSLGDIAEQIENEPENTDLRDAFNRLMDNRNKLSSSSEDYWTKSEGMAFDGFGNINQYFDSDTVEFLTFYGTIFDRDSRSLRRNKIITIVDRCFVVSEVDNPSWLGMDGLFHTSWRKRPDNLWGMGALDNLVGMQYRIDHLENMKATIFDQIGVPDLIIRGDVETSTNELGQIEYLVGDEGDVRYLNPDVNVLQADFQIQRLEQLMEELAGAPKSALGIRTPGEKTAFEVETLANSANRVFVHKTAHFERTFLEPIIQYELELSRRKFDRPDVIRIVDDVQGVEIFRTITKEDLKANGKLVPYGARHLSERARELQELLQIQQAKADPSVAVHLSGKRVAQRIAEVLKDRQLYGENIAITEQMETESMAANAEVEFGAEQEELAEMGM